MEKRRHIISALLLAVIVPALLFSSLHKHHTVPILTEECSECVHHLPHAGHIGSSEDGISDCYLCHFLCVPFVISLAAVILPHADIKLSFYDNSCEFYVKALLRHNNPRAPPVVSFA